MDRILVTGSEGFIGKHLMKSIEATGFDLGSDAVLGPFDGIIHLAAISRVSEAESDPVSCMETNLVLTARLIEWKPKWFIFVSTDEFPHNVYGISKRFAEDYCSMMCEKYGIRLKIVRFPVVYGPGDNPKKLIPSIRAGGRLNGGVLPITAMHVNDAVHEILSQIHHLHSRIVIDTVDKLNNVAHSY